MLDPSGRYMLSFNGEIYNFRELRAQLSATGVRFISSGDTEVLLNALIAWGPDALSRLRGQFAVAFWDASRQSLLLARDRFGIVPLFWSAPSPNRILFASEVKAIAAAGVAIDVSPPDLLDAVTLWGLQPGRSVFESVYSVEPGGYLDWSSSGGPRRGRYWSFDFADQRDSRSLPDQAAELRELLGRAVARRVPEYDAPAVLLSGGLDSTAVLAILRGVVPTDGIKSYSIEFPHKTLDESAFQLRASRAFATKHHPIMCADATVASHLVEAVRHAEMPLVRTAPAASLALAATIEADGTRAVLSGEGADELFCGYDLFKLAAIRDTWGDRDDLAEISAQIDVVMSQQKGLGRAVEPAFYEQGLDHRDDPLFSHLNRWTAAYRASLYLLPELREDLPLTSILERTRQGLPRGYTTWPVVEQAQYLEMTYFLQWALLASQADRPYMAHSIEARYPFLDEDVIDFALALPLTSKLDGLNEKAVLKAAVADCVPPEIVHRVKQPYTAPEGDIFRSEAGRLILDEYVSPAALRQTGLFDPKRVAWLVRKLQSSRTSFHDDLALLWVTTTQILARSFGPDRAA